MKVAVIDMPWFNSKIKYLKSEGEVTHRPVLPRTIKDKSLKQVEICPFPSSHAQGQQQQNLIAILPVLWMTAFKSPVWQSVLGVCPNRFSFSLALVGVLGYRKCRSSLSQSQPWRNTGCKNLGVAVWRSLGQRGSWASVIRQRGS